MAKSRFYTPRKITLGPGVTSQQVNARTDSFMGSAEVLERAGVLTSEMLPSEGACNIAWRPVGQQRKGGSVVHEPGYIVIHRNPAGGFRAYVTVSREEQARRYAAINARHEQWKHECEARQRDREANAQADWLQSADELRDQARIFLEVVRRLLIGSGSHGPFQFRLGGKDADQAEEMLDGLSGFIAQGPICVDRPMAARVELKRRTAAARRDASLQAFLGRVQRTSKRRKSI